MKDKGMLPKQASEQPGKGKMSGGMGKNNVTETNRKTLKNAGSLQAHEKFHNGMAKKLGC